MNSPQPATTAPRQKAGQTLKLIAVALFVAFGLPLLLLSGFLAWRQYRVLTSWPMVDAVVTRVDWTKAHTSRPPITSYGVRFSFRYTAAGRVYDSSADLGYTSSGRSDIEHRVAQMPVGSHRPIRYDPSNPGNISLAGDFTPLSFSAPFTLAKWAGVIAAACAGLFLLGWRGGRRAPGGPLQP